jgi:hypothetical protein
MIAS